MYFFSFVLNIETRVTTLRTQLLARGEWLKLRRGPAALCAFGISVFSVDNDLQTHKVCTQRSDITEIFQALKENSSSIIMKTE
jgi:hypothetical protein